MTYKAFVSSTYIDLKEHRARVIDALRDAGIHVDPMENWTADGDEPKEVSVERMDGCDFCILLVGARRGHVPENETLSITQMEVLKAGKLGIEVLPFLYDGESPWPPAYYELKDDDELRRWRDEIMEHSCPGKFTVDPASLDAPVRDAVVRWIQKQGWPEVLKAYLETLRDAHASIRFLGIGHYKDIPDRSIESLFVDPGLASQHISPDTPPKDWPKISTLLDLVSAEKRLVLLGDPGSGKSTLVSWIVWNLTQEGENQWKRALDRRTPLVLILRELSLERVRTWNDLLTACLNHLTARPLGAARHQSHINEMLESGRAAIFLDGLDEVGNPRIQERLREAVWEGMRKYPDCVWILTSRVVGYLGYHEGPNPGAPDRKPRMYAQLRYVVPFDNDQIKKFALNWYTTRDRSAIRAKGEADRFIEAVHANPYTLNLARIPNLLTMMALIHRERARLPHGRALLYNDIAKAYLQSIDEHRRIERLGYSLRDQKQWLGRIGFEMQLRRHRSRMESDKDEEKEILVEGRDVRKWVLSAMRDAGRTDSNEEAADAFLDEICRRSGLLLPRGEDQFAFMHLSFQEFFAAVFFVPQFMLPPRSVPSKGVSGARPEDLHSYAENRTWHETLVFLAELMFAEQPEWLEELLFCLFGEGFSEVEPRTTIDSKKDNPKPTLDPELNQAILLARLAVDPHAGFAERGLKSNAITRCCAFEAYEQKRNEEEIEANIRRRSFFHNYKPEVFGVLLGGDREEACHVCRTFSDSLRDADVRTVSFLNCPIDDLSPFAHISGLRTLHLTASNVTDLSPLSGWERLQWLVLNNTQVKDLSPLKGLTAIQSLDLDDTQVKDLSPLKGLTDLQALDLNRTQVKDLSPLKGLTDLQFLILTNTQVSKVDISEFDKILPKCRIIF